MAKFDEVNMSSMINSRMGWNVNEPKCPFRRIVPTKVGERVAIYVVNNDSAFLIHDEVALFPSDGFVTKLRLIESGQEPGEGVQ